MKFYVSGFSFNGHEVSAEGKRQGFVDYGTLAKGFNHVLNNNIINAVDDWEEANGDFYDNETGEEKTVFQWYIIDHSGFLTLTDCTDEIVIYSEQLDVYLWGVTHYGTSWDYVMTDIPCNTGCNA